MKNSSAARLTFSNPPSVLNRPGWFHLAVLAILTLLAAPAAFAGTVTQTANNGGNQSSYNQLTSWDSGVAPTAGNDYFTAFQMRSPVVSPGGAYLTGTQVFAGDSLTINGSANGFIQGKANVTLSFINGTGLFLNGGGLFSANNDVGLGVNIMSVTGLVTVVSGSTNYIGALGLGQNQTAYEVLDMQSVIGGSGNLIIGGPNAGNQNDTGQLSGVAELDAANTFSGTVSVSIPSGNAISGIASTNRGLLQLNNLNALQNATLSLGSSFGPTNLVSFSSSINTGTFNVGALAGAGNLALTDTNGGAVSLNVGSNNASTTNSGALTGAGSLTKSGTGMMTLSGTNTYTGNTTNNGGTLLINGSIAGNLIVNSGATNGGSGTISGNVTVNSGGIIRPGASGAATNTINGNLSYNAAGQTIFDLTGSATGAGNSQIILGGASSVLNGNNATVTISAASLDTADYVLYNLPGASSAVSSSFNTTPAWLGTPPAGSANYIIETVGFAVGKTVVLHNITIPGLAINSVVPSTTTPTRNQSVTVTANVTYSGGTTPSATATLNASGLNPADSAIAMARQSFSGGVAVYTNTVTVSASAAYGATTLTVVASDTVGDLATNSVVVTLLSPVVFNSVVPSTTTPVRNQNVTVTANITYSGGTTPSATATLNASGLNSADSALALVEQSFSGGVAVYTNTVTVDPSAAFGATNLTVVASDTVGDLATNSVVVTVIPSVVVTSIVPSTTTPTRNQNVTVTANINYYGGNTPNTATLNASGLNSADSALALVQQSYNVGTGVAVYTNTVTVSASAALGATNLTVVASDNGGDLATNSVVVTVTAATQTWGGGGFVTNGIGNWSDATNWVSGVAPLPTYDNVTFAGTNGLNNTNDFVTSVGTITFSSGAGAFNLLGNALSIAGATIATDSSAGNTNTIGMATTWAAAINNATVTVTPAAGATLTFAGNVTMTATNLPNGDINLPAGASNNPAVTQFGGTVNISVATDTNDVYGFGGFTMRQDTIMNLLPGAIMNFSGGCFYVGQNTGLGIGISNNMATLNVAAGATLNLATNSNFGAGANVNHGANEFEWGTININGTINALVGPTNDGPGYIRLGFADGNVINTRSDPLNGTINLNSGGVLVTSREIVCGGSFNALRVGQLDPGVNGIFNFNGGTLKTDGVNPVSDWLGSFNGTPVVPSIAPLTAVTIGPLGAFIDTAGTSATIGANMVSNSIPDGGLTKLGLGTLTLSGANTYTGNTTISAGTLALVTGNFYNGQIEGNITIAGGATLDVSAASPSPYILLGNIFAFGGAVPSTNNGALNVPLTTTNVLNYTNNAIPALVASGGALAFSGTNFVVNGPVLPTGSYTVITVANGGSVTNITTNVVTGVTGTAIGTSAAQIKFNAGATTATLLVTNSVSLNPATANFKFVLVNGGTAMNFTWALDHKGWQLYTNSVGLTATGSWFPVPGSAAVTNETINIYPARPQVFFQLRNP